MQKLTLVGVSYTVMNIEGMTFLIPTHLRRFERDVISKIKKSFALLKKTGWYEYVAMAEMITILVPSLPSGKIGLVINGDAPCGVFLGDTGAIAGFSVPWFASVFVHEATHVLQKHYLPAKKYRSIKNRELDACREQVKFLRSCARFALIKRIRRAIRKKRPWWSTLHKPPKTAKEKRVVERHAYFSKIHDALIPHFYNPA